MIHAHGIVETEYFQNQLPEKVAFLSLIWLNKRKYPSTDLYARGLEPGTNMWPLAKINTRVLC